MSSPFPGMNPYLEHPAVWPDFHNALIYAIRDLLAPKIAPQYVARGETQLYIHELPNDDRRLMGRADLGFTPVPSASMRLNVATKDAPVHGNLPAVDFERLQYLEIRDRVNRQVVTVIEVLSPTNKNPGPDRTQYISKRNQLLRSNVNLVEIDLLRGGPRMPIEGLPPCDYCIMTCRPEDWPRAGIWPIRLADRLPEVSIPLRTREESVTLDLQVALNRVYDGALYEMDIYVELPVPPLVAADAEWARQFVPTPR